MSHRARGKEGSSLQVVAWSRAQAQSLPTNSSSSSDNVHLPVPGSMDASGRMTSKYPVDRYINATPE